MSIEYKDVAAEVKALDDTGEGVLRFIKFNQEDKDSDITLQGFVGQQEAILISAHNWKSDYPPIGRGESFEADGSTLFRFRLNLQDPRAQVWHSWLKLDRQFQHPLQQISYGFSIHPDGQEYGQKDGRRVRYLKPRPDASPGAKLHEVSFVTVGSGNDTAVLDLKSVYPHPAHRRQFWSGGLTPMMSAKEHLSTAVPSVRTALRHVETLRRLVGDIPPTAKTKRVNEFIDATLEELDTGVAEMERSLDKMQEPSPPVTPLIHSQAVETLPAVTTTPTITAISAVDADGEEVTDPEQKWSMKEELDRLITETAHVAEALENTKRKRAESSARYPHGRPLSADRLSQVQDLVVRLSRLKVATEQREQQDVAQQELQEMAERFKQLSVSV